MKSNLFDTHCHLNFSRFKKDVREVIQKAEYVGVKRILVPGTDLATSKKAIELVSQYDGMYAAIGIHPHHLFSYINNAEELKALEQGILSLMNKPKVIGIGEVGLDYYLYEKTKHSPYQIDEHFMTLQKNWLHKQMGIAFTYKKTLILHNRNAIQDLLLLLSEWGNTIDTNKIVFHCCEPDKTLLEYAKKHHIYIGVDGDVTYNTVKQEFIKHIPKDLLVFETDSPYLLPEPLRSEKKFPNTPSNLPLIAKFVAETLDEDVKEIAEQTYLNSLSLFSLPEDK